jgi:hypothetical protein
MGKYWLFWIFVLPVSNTRSCFNVCTHLRTTNVLGMHSFCVIPYHMIFTQNRFCNYHVLHIKCSICLFLVFFEVCRSLAIFSHSNLALFPSINDTLRATSQISQISSVARFLVTTCKLGLICVWMLFVNKQPPPQSYNKQIYRRWCVKFNFSLGRYFWRFFLQSQEIGGAFFHSPFSRETDITFRMLTVVTEQYFRIVSV